MTLKELSKDLDHYRDLLNEASKGFEEIDEAIKKLEIKQDPIVESHERVMPEVGERYSYFSMGGYIATSTWNGDVLDKDYFKRDLIGTKECLQKKDDIRLASVRLQDAWRKDYYWVPDWSDRLAKYQICGWDYIVDSTALIGNYSVDKSKLGLIFKTKKDMETFISDNAEDLKLVLKRF